MKAQVYKAPQLNAPYTPRYEQHCGRPHIIVPVVMMVEGVHHGSAGPSFHSADELSNHYAAWNGRPVVIYHPDLDVSETGSANIPEFYENNWIVGRLYNANFSDGKLRAEAWIDIQHLSLVDNDALEMIKASQPINVSIGVFTDDEHVEGDWNNEHYTVVSRNHRPDHLAILPHADGACSLADGCGVRTNQKGNTMKERINAEAILINMAPAVRETINLNEANLLDLIRNIRAKLDAMDTDSRWHFLEQVTEDAFVYRVGMREGGHPDQYYRRSYTTDENGVIEFGTEPEPVVKKETYETVNQNDNNDKGDKKMTQKNKDAKPCCEEKIALLAKSGLVSEETIQAMAEWPEKAVDDMIALHELATKEPEPAKPADKPETPPQANAQAITPEAAIQALQKQIPGLDTESLKYGAQLYQKQRAELEAQVLSAGDTYTEAEVKAMEYVALAKLASFIKSNQPADYSINGGGAQMNSTIAPLLPPGVTAQ